METDGLDSAVGMLCGEGIPSLLTEEGLPCDSNDLITNSPRIPATTLDEIGREDNKNYQKINVITEYLSKLEGALLKYDVDEDLVFGIDIGTSSCGLAAIRAGRIEHLSVRLFDSALDPYTGAPKNVRRRQMKQQRRRLRRKAKRKQLLRDLLKDAGMWPGDHAVSLMDPYKLRADGLTRRLSPGEFGFALFHTVGRRGYLSSSYAQAGLETSHQQTGPIARMAAQNVSRAQEFRTAGAMFALAPEFQAGKRNRRGNFRSALPRHAVLSEVRELFRVQAELGQPPQVLSVEAPFVEIAFHQNKPASSFEMVGNCPYIPQQRRASRFAPSVERYNLVDALTKLWLCSEDERRRLTGKEIQSVTDRFGRSASVTRMDVRRFLGLPDAVTFGDKAKEDTDIVDPTGFGCVYGTTVLRGVLGRRNWRALSEEPEKLDAITDIVTFSRDPELVTAKLQELELPEHVAETIVEALEDGEFAEFSGAAKISAVAARRMLPFLEQANLAFDAAILAKLDPLAIRRAALEHVTNPAVIRALLETIKQARFLVHELGALPGRINVEVARDIAMTHDQRLQVQDIRRKRNVARRNARTTLAEHFAATDINDQMIERFFLWQAQSGFCVYSGEPISISELADGHVTQIDHILPVSRSGDYTRNNTVLCFCRANQEKGNLSPYEWFGSDEVMWKEFARRVRWMALPESKRMRLLSRTFAQREGVLIVRNLNDTAYTARCAISAFQFFYSDTERHRRVTARPGRLTAVLRRAWGLNKDRSDARHHAMDALVTAAASEQAVYYLSKAVKRSNRGKDWAVRPPWTGFVQDAHEALAKVGVSMAERRRGRGRVHDDTIRQTRTDPVDGKRILFERRPLDRVRAADLARLRHGGQNRALYHRLNRWFDGGANVNVPPISPQGDPVRRVRISLDGVSGIPKDGIAVRGGISAFGDLVRLDIYSCDGKFAFVPVHTLQVGTMPKPPMLSIVRGKSRAEWQTLDEQWQFRFSVYRNSYLHIVRSNGAEYWGYFRGLDTSTLRISLADPFQLGEVQRVSVSRATSIEKFTVDRFGRHFQVRSEVRTWAGKNMPLLQAQQKVDKRNASKHEAVSLEFEANP